MLFGSCGTVYLTRMQDQSWSMGELCKTNLCMTNVIKNPRLDILLVSRALIPDVQSKLYHHFRRHYQHQVQGDCYSCGTHHYHHAYCKAIFRSVHFLLSF